MVITIVLLLKRVQIDLHLDVLRARLVDRGLPSADGRRQGAVLETMNDVHVRQEANRT